jgi:maltooligosyltrehalose trehalohydrolase
MQTVKPFQKNEPRNDLERISRMTVSDGQRVARRLPVGAEIIDGRAHFRVWAPLRNRVEVVTSRASFPLQREDDGYFSALVDDLHAGDTYRFRLDGGDAFPDPASRFQPEGPHGPSQIIDHAAFHWTDETWPGVQLAGQIIYEIHIGTFTREGTWQSATLELPALARTGITVIEVMPVADFAGRFGWGYDGVNWFSPTRLYGTPDDMRRFIDAAHSLGMGVILDVVYNHFGPDGNYSGQFSRDYVTSKHTTDWGEAINYDGEDCQPVRDFVSANAHYWIEEFHLDGLRLDATQNIYDDSEDNILAVITRSVRKAAGDRKTIVIAENEPQEIRFVDPPETGGYGMDGLWNDDYHHSALVGLAGRNEAYYSDYLGKPQEFISALKYGYLYQGQWYNWQKQRRGTPSLHAPGHAFVNFLENHDQVANSARGLRTHQLTSPGMYRAMMALTVLGPGVPMLFQGQEYASSAPFQFFADMPEWLAPSIREGRKDFFKQWRSIRTESMLACIADPCSSDTFAKCKLDHSEREKHGDVYQFHCDLIRLKRTDPVLSAQPPVQIDGAVLSSQAFLVRFFGPGNDDRLLLINLGVDLHLSPAPEPLLAPPQGNAWRTLFSTEIPQYGGCGSPEPDGEELNWSIQGQAAVLLGPGPRRTKSVQPKEKSSK